MTALLLENLKLIMLFLLIGSIIGLSHLSGGKAKPARRIGVAATAGRHRLAAKRSMKNVGHRTYRKNVESPAAASAQARSRSDRLSAGNRQLRCARRSGAAQGCSMHIVEGHRRCTDAAGRRSRPMLLSSTVTSTRPSNDDDLPIALASGLLSKNRSINQGDVS